MPAEEDNENAIEYLLDFLNDSARVAEELRRAEVRGSLIGPSDPDI